MGYTKKELTKQERNKVKYIKDLQSIIMDYMMYLNKDDDIYIRYSDKTLQEFFVWCESTKTLIL